MRDGVVELGPLGKADLEFVRQLRNRLRHWFFDSRPVSPAQHRAWFDRLKQQPEAAFYVIRLDGVPVGTISLRETSEGTEVGNLMLNESARGRGIMQDVCRQLLVPGRTYFARIKPENLPSLKLFMRLGFALTQVVMERSAESAA